MKIKEDFSAPFPLKFDDIYEVDIPRRKRYGKQVEPRTGPKIGRNDPCPCGSGKKYKKCDHSHATPTNQQ